MKNRLPIWLRKNKRLSDLREIKIRLRNASLSTVCEEARCPNIGECFTKPTATFLILGDTCTRACRFCSIKKGRPKMPDPEEPVKVAKASSDLALKHVVITSVTRDDLPDKGAMAFAQTIRKVRKTNPDATVEVLIPDFTGRHDLLKVVLDEKPDVFNHNVETIDRLYTEIRPGADIEQSLNILRYAKTYSPETVVKSGFMVGLGEEDREIENLLMSLKNSGVDVVTIGQYMRPTKDQIPVAKYWTPDDFNRWNLMGSSIGLPQVISGPFVRSSYHAKEILEEIKGENEIY